MVGHASHMRQVLIRHVFRGEHIASAVPATVVEETDERVVYWRPMGTPMRWIDPYPGSLPLWAEGGYRTVATEWKDNDCLHLSPFGRAHDVSLWWRGGTGEFLGWYVNLQEPLRRTRLGFDTMDQELDITISPSFTWRWKDEDKFAERVELGFLTTDEADAVRAEGERVIADLEARRRPFDEPWPSWRPDPSWPLPPLPDDWAVL